MQGQPYLQPHMPSAGQRPLPPHPFRAAACRAAVPQRQQTAWLSGPTRPCTLLQLHLGVDARALGFKLEQQAVNDATFRVPDQRGWQPTGQLIDDRPGCTLNTHLKTDLDVGQLAGGACVGAEASTVEEESWGCDQAASCEQHQLSVQRFRLSEEGC